ncbi:MAG: selenium cofactor biosynthesis protein YqeC [Clostridiales bacterium]|nr:selenium cofactor biosynthesis protein YqeC [Clostridiales bacterium]MDR2711697.1 putative selenium-dependent hydroxylase accessory protein YqeC [Clostridiales bacterium]
MEIKYKLWLEKDGEVFVPEAENLVHRYEAFYNECENLIRDCYLKHFDANDKEEEKHEHVLPVNLKPLELGEKEIIALVGGGGKSSLMYALAEDLASAGARVVILTTTKVYLPPHGLVDRLIISHEEGILDQLEAGLGEGDIVAVCSGVKDGKLRAVSEELIEEISRRNIADYIFVEADGAAGRPFKAPAPHEPPIPACATLVMCVVGIDVLGKALSSNHCYRPEFITKNFGLEAGEIIDEHLVAQVITSPQGGKKNLPGDARWLPVINKIDAKEDIAAAKRMARALAQEQGVEEIVFASALDLKLRVRVWHKRQRE